MINLRDYQIDICNTKPNKLFLGTGLGKTYISLELFERSGCSKLLVISPAMAKKRKEWKESILNKTGFKSYEIPKNKNLDKQIYIGSYKSIANRPKILDWLDKDTFIILDESHNIMSSKIFTTNSFSTNVKFIVEKIAPLTHHKVIVTATPQSKGWLNVFPQLKFLGELDMTIKEFKREYCIEEIDRSVNVGYPIMKVTGYRNTEKLEALLSHRAAYLEHNPSMKLEEAIVDIPYEAHEVYAKFKKASIIKVNSKDYFAENPGQKRAVLSLIPSGFLYQEDLGLELVDRRRIDLIKRMLADTSDRRLAIFVNRKVEEFVVKQLVEESNRPLCMQTGTHKFNDSKEATNAVWIVNYGSASEGWDEIRNTETLVSTMVFYSPPPSLIKYTQSKGRIKSSDQIYHPTYYRIYCKGTYEEVAYKSYDENKDWEKSKLSNY